MPCNAPATVLLMLLTCWPCCRARAWSYILVPLLAASLILHAASWVGWEQLLPGITQPLLSPQLAQWLGLAWVPPQTLWALLAAYAAAVMQAHTDSALGLGRSSTPDASHASKPGSSCIAGSGSAAEPQGPPGGVVRGRWQGRHYGANDDDEDTSLQVPLLHEGAVDIEQGRVQTQHPTSRLLVHPAPTPAPGQAVEAGAEGEAAVSQKLPRLFSPVAAAHQPHWHWLDWVRYFILQHSLDALLVSALLCEAGIDDQQSFPAVFYTGPGSISWGTVCHQAHI
jgi:hypothetical protein